MVCRIIDFPCASDVRVTVVSVLSFLCLYTYDTLSSGLGIAGSFRLRRHRRSTGRALLILVLVKYRDGRSVALMRSYPQR